VSGLRKSGGARRRVRDAQRLTWLRGFCRRAVARCVRDASADAAIVATDAAPPQSQFLALAASTH